MNEKLIFVIALIVTVAIVIFTGCEDSVGPSGPPAPPDTTEDTTGVDTTEVPDSSKREIEDIVMVPAGYFTMGSNTWYYENDETPQNQVNVDSFYIMIYEVTNEQYAKFLTESEEPSIHHHTNMLIGRQGGNYIADGGRENYPVYFVDWDDANSFAEWYGGRLPTEAEWEKAARGDTDSRVFPWGAQISPSYANFNNSEGGIWPVGQSIGTTPYGCYDMVGNVWEWTADWYQYDYYSRGETNNPQGPFIGHYKTVRGGCYANDETIVRCSERSYVDPVLSYITVGFRVVFSPDSVRPAE